MKRAELLSRLIVTVAISGAVGMPLYLWSRTPILHAQMAENGGWYPDVLQVEAGKPLHLKLTSDDVMHGFAVGQMDMDPVDVKPGNVTDVTLTFNEPGIYTFYCSRWCGPNHWRMRGTIEVTGSSISSESFDQTPGKPASPPLYVSLNLDIDAPHDAPSVPGRLPSAVVGQSLAMANSITLSHKDYLAKSPYEVFDGLKNNTLTDGERWDIVAHLWQSNTTPEAITNGKQIYGQNCAACHGENGEGNGVFADDLAEAGQASMQTMNSAEGMIMKTPVDFTDPKQMLGASPALLQGKILRGGMGTGMPMWGSIFIEEQIWDVIAYLYAFQFEYPD